MALDGVLGRIDSVDGEGNVLIIRASGEVVVAKIGDSVSAGDRVVASDKTTVRISLSGSEVSGVVSIAESGMAVFTESLFDNVASLLPGSSDDQPVAVGEVASESIIEQFNAIFPGGGISSAEQDSRSDQVVDIDSLEGLPAPGVGAQDGALPSGDNVEGSGRQVLPGAGDEGEQGGGGEVVRGAVGVPVDFSPETIFQLPLPPLPPPPLPPPPEPPPPGPPPPGPPPPEPPEVLPPDLGNDVVSTFEDTPLLAFDVTSNDLVGRAAIESGNPLGGLAPDTGSGVPVDNGDPLGDPAPDVTPDITGGGSDPGVGIVDPAIPDSSVSPPPPETVFLDPGGPATSVSAFASKDLGSSSSGGSLARSFLSVASSSASALAASPFNPSEGASIVSASGIPIRIFLVGEEIEVDERKGVRTAEGGLVSLNADGTFSYFPRDNFSGADSFEYRLLVEGDSPEAGAEATGTVTINVASVDDAPINNVPDAVDVTEDELFEFTGENAISVTDLDSAENTNDAVNADNIVNTVLTVMDGRLSIDESLVGSSSLTLERVEGVRPEDMARYTGIRLIGTVSEVNEALASLTYQGAADFNGSDTLTIMTADEGAGLELISDENTVAITVTAVNDAPVSDFVFSDVTLSTDAGVPLALGDVLSIQDADGDILTATLSVDHGSLSLTASSLLSIEGNDTGSITIMGTQEAINAASNLTYQGDSDYSGLDMLSVSFMDTGGLTGSYDVLNILVVDDP